MIKNYFLGLMVFLPFLSFGQIEFHLDGDPGVNYNGDTLVIVSTGLNVYDDLRVVNVSGITQGYKWRRKIISSSSGSYTDQLCDNQLCFDCTGDTRTSPAFMNIAAGDSTLFQPKLNSAGVGGTAHYRYYVLNSSMIVLDSMDIIFTTSVGIGEAKKIEYKAYPNPASETFNLSVTSTMGASVQVLVYNVVGSEVMRKNIVNGLNTISVESLDNGIYFYSILVNNEITETKKLIIRH